MRCPPPAAPSPNFFDRVEEMRECGRVDIGEPCVVSLPRGSDAQVELSPAKTRLCGVHHHSSLQFTEDDRGLSTCPVQTAAPAVVARNRSIRRIYRLANAPPDVATTFRRRPWS